MRGKTVLFVFLWAVASCSAILSEANEIEARGKKKKKKIALFGKQTEKIGKYSSIIIYY